MGLFIRTKKAIDEAKWKAKGGDKRGEGFMLYINPRSADVQFRWASSCLLSNVKWSDCHLTGLLLFSLGRWFAHEPAQFTGRETLERPSCEDQEKRKYALKCFLFCTWKEKKTLSKDKKEKKLYYLICQDSHFLMAFLAFPPKDVPLRISLVDI